MAKRALVIAVLLGASALWVAPVYAAPAAAQWSDEDLQGFFDALQDARSTEEASVIEKDIARMLARSDSPTINLMLDRAQRALASGDTNAARTFLDHVVLIAPNFAEGWRRRGEVAALQHDYADAIDDLTKAVKLQPRHFLALQSLGKLYEDSQDAGSAIEYYQTALALDPWLPTAREGLKRLGAAQSQIGAATTPPVGAGKSDTLRKGGV